jgi:hypothetical protein
MVGVTLPLLVPFMRVGPVSLQMPIVRLGLSHLILSCFVLTVGLISQSLTYLASYATVPLVLLSEVVPLVVPVEELTRSASVSAGASNIALEISHALGESLSVVQAQYFGDNDVGELEGILADERDHLREDLQAREEWDEAQVLEHRQEILLYYEDSMF